jgi:hypothetical protein
VSVSLTRCVFDSSFAFGKLDSYFSEKLTTVLSLTFKLVKGESTPLLSGASAIDSTARKEKTWAGGKGGNRWAAKDRSIGRRE